MAEVEIVAHEIQGDDGCVEVGRATFAGAAVQPPAGQGDLVSEQAGGEQANRLRSRQRHPAELPAFAGSGKHSEGQGQVDGADSGLEHQLASQAIVFPEEDAAVADVDARAEFAVAATAAVNIHEQTIKPDTVDARNGDTAGIDPVGGRGEVRVGITEARVSETLHVDHAGDGSGIKPIEQERQGFRGFAARVPQAVVVEQVEQRAAAHEQVAVLPPQLADADITIAGTEQGPSAEVERGVEA